jgi:hypothetical protein
VRAARQLAPAVAQAEQRVELLDELGRDEPPAHRADAHRVSRRRLARHLEDRERDVEAAPQVDVAVGLRLPAHVARRLEGPDQPRLEQQRAELGVGGLVVDLLRVTRPDRAGIGEVRPRPRAQADRLADVERAAVGVAEDVDPRVLGQPREVGAALGRAARRGRLRTRAAPSRRAEQRERLPHRPGVRAQAPEQGAEHPGAGLGVGQRPVRRVDLDPERVGERREPAAALQRGEAAGHRDRAEHGRRRPVEPRARERLAQHPLVEARRVRDEHPPAQPDREVGQHRLGGRRRLEHGLGDPGEALDAAAERSGDADERAPAVVQLAAADEHRAHLGELALLAGTAVRLRVDGEELGRGQRLGGEVGGEKHGPRRSKRPSGRGARTLASTRSASLRLGFPPIA